MAVFFLQGHIDLYNVYGPCISGTGHPDQDAADTALAAAPPRTQAQTLAAHIKGRDARNSGVEVELGGPDACIDSITASDYFNQADVQKALHVSPFCQLSLDIFASSACGGACLRLELT